jgi:hypothetical protein
MVVRSTTTGTRSLVAYVPGTESKSSHDLQWRFVVSTPLSVAYAPQRRLLEIVALGTLTTALLAGVITMSITRQATRSLVAEIEDRKEIERRFGTSARPGPGDRAP